MINSIKGYGYGLKGWELAPTCAKEDLLNGISSNLGCMTKIPNMKSAGYWAATVAMISMTAAKAYEVLNVLISSSGDSFLLGTRLFRLAKFKLLAVIMFTLKDAADRGRLEGTTFVELNLMAAVSYALWAVFAMQDAAYTMPYAASMGLISLFTAFNGLSSISKKNSKK